MSVTVSPQRFPGAPRPHAERALPGVRVVQSASQTRKSPRTAHRRAFADMKKRQARKLHEEAQRCFRVADRTADNKVAAALLAYASELEQRARLIDSAKKSLPAHTEAHRMVSEKIAARDCSTNKSFNGRLGPDCAERCGATQQSKSVARISKAAGLVANECLFLARLCRK